MSRVSFEMPLPSSCEKKTQNIWRKNNSPPMFEPRCILHGNLTLPMPMISRKKTPLKKKRGDDLTHHPLKFFGNCGRGQSAGASEWDEIPGSTKIGDGTWTMNGSMYMCINNMYIYIYLEPFHVFSFGWSWGLVFLRSWLSKNWGRNLGSMYVNNIHCYIMYLIPAQKKYERSCSRESFALQGRLTFTAFQVGLHLYEFFQCDDHLYWDLGCPPGT